MKEKPYKAQLIDPNGDRVIVDFYADSAELARDHAERCLADTSMWPDKQPRRVERVWRA